MHGHRRIQLRKLPLPWRSALPRGSRVVGRRAACRSRQRPRSHPQRTYCPEASAGRPDSGQPAQGPSDLQQALSPDASRSLSDLNKAMPLMIVATSGTQDGGATANYAPRGRRTNSRSLTQRRSIHTFPWSLSSPGGDPGSHDLRGAANH